MIEQTKAKRTDEAEQESLKLEMLELLWEG